MLSSVTLGSYLVNISDKFLWISPSIGEMVVSSLLANKCSGKSLLISRDVAKHLISSKPAGPEVVKFIVEPFLTFLRGIVIICWAFSCGPP